MTKRKSNYDNHAATRGELSQQHQANQANQSCPTTTTGVGLFSLRAGSGRLCVCLLDCSSSIAMTHNDDRIGVWGSFPRFHFGKSLFFMYNSPPLVRFHLLFPPLFSRLLSLKSLRCLLPFALCSPPFFTLLFPSLFPPSSTISIYPAPPPSPLPGSGFGQSPPLGPSSSSPLQKVCLDLVKSDAAGLDFSGLRDVG